MTGPASSRFSPRALDPEQLERLTVAREDLLSQLQTKVVDAVVSGQARFDLLLGPRGAGKSHIVGVLEGRLRASPQLVGRALVVAPPEELHPTSLVGLLAQLLREFPDDPELGPAEAALRSLQRQRDGNQEQRAVDLIRGRLGGRALIILLENLDELFGVLGHDGQQRLRNVLQTERRWSILASSRSLVPAFTKYKAPFHGTFNLHPLEPLTPEQCRDMLAALADAHSESSLAELLRTSKGLARVRGIHHLLGGNPRAMTFVFRQLDEHRLDHFELALANLADELKPYFQEQMTRLSPAQRAVMEILAESWRPLTVTELAERSFSKQASTSGALRHLRRDALVQALDVGRERYYELGDPLHRLARANERPREAIVAFTRVIRWWYADDSASDFSLRRHYVLPEQARVGWSATEELENDSMHESSLKQAMTLLDQLPLIAIEQARAQLAQRQSPAIRAALVLALERSGDEAAAVEELLAALGPHDLAVVASLMTLSSHRAIDAGASKGDSFALPLDSAIARAVQCVWRTSTSPKLDEGRRALLESFDSASPVIARLLSDIVARSPLLPSWTEQAAYAELGQLLVRLRPTRSSVSLESGLTHGIWVAWHHRRTTELLPPGASLDPLLSVLPDSLRGLVAIVSFSSLGALPPARTSGPAFDEVVAQVQRRFVLAGDAAPEAALAELGHTHAAYEQTFAGALLEFFAMLSEAPKEMWLEHISGVFDAKNEFFSRTLFLGVYTWLASRRPLEPLVRLAVRLHELYEVYCIPAPILQANSPREAIARLSEPERALIRAILESHDDTQGLAQLALEAKT